MKICKTCHIEKPLEAFEAISGTSYRRAESYFKKVLH